MGSWAGADLLASQRATPNVVFQRRGKLTVLEHGWTIPVKTLDVSANGIGLLSPEPIRPTLSCALQVSTLHQGIAQDLSLKGMVAYCILSGLQGFRVGIQYTEVDPASKSFIARLISSID